MCHAFHQAAVAHFRSLGRRPGGHREDRVLELTSSATDSLW